ncbi:thiol-disulfide oxidoreductase DCC family protein [Pseudoalteromonas phenolica]|uniref:thiol-disulfide oxidoreductase DCC family protein n=1 Tax=Pseudoalteromonas phenolica TaxID=161398 RepID=UPI00384C00EB
MQLLYDGLCPLCAKEMQKLKQYDFENKLTLINVHDIHELDFKRLYPNITKSDTLKILHGYADDGRLLLGLDANVQAWQTVGKYPWLKLLRVQPIKWFADKGYLFFAKHRMKISRFIVKDGCNNGQCQR